MYIYIYIYIYTHNYFIQIYNFYYMTKFMRTNKSIYYGRFDVTKSSSA